MPEIQIEWASESEYERLRNTRDRHGMLWRGILIEGAKQAESHDLYLALLELNPALTQDVPTNPTQGQEYTETRSTNPEQQRPPAASCAGDDVESAHESELPSRSAFTDQNHRTAPHMSEFDALLGSITTRENSSDGRVNVQDSKEAEVER